MLQAEPGRNFLSCKVKWRFFLLGIFFLSAARVEASTIYAELNTNWRFRKSGDQEWMPATVPGTVHTDLFGNKKIPDPFFGDNETRLQWIDTCDWEYELWFNADDSIIHNTNCGLTFEGLDTYAKVFLNDSLILEAYNMFRHWNVDCKKILRPDNNHLFIRFESASRRGRQEAAKRKVVLPGEEKVYTRKAQYQYGWDWGPRFVGAGIWKPVKFYSWTDLKIENIQLAHGQVTDSLVSVTAAVKIAAEKSTILYLKVVVEGTRRDSFYFERLMVNPAGETVTLNFNIKNPKRWCSSGSGDPALYNFYFSVMNTARALATDKVRYGLRDIELVQEKDSAGKSFYFRENGKPVFMKGANWIPADHFLPRMTGERYRELLVAAKDANMNMLRVWGGGIYENDFFYDLCDSLGITVWQDFMFACAMYPADSLYVENVKEEIRDNVRRLRNHPCIALWCGNNEIDEGWKNWGWQKQYNYSAEDSVQVWKDYLKLFRQAIPEVLNTLDTTRNYWESSPSVGWGHEESLRSGDSHYWGVWWGMEPFEIYAKKTGRFMSEYGFQGMPSPGTIASFTAPDDRKLNSAPLKNHQKHKTGYETIEHYMKEWYRKPKNFESFVYVSGLLQAEGMKMAIEAHRRAKPYCMGSLYWQLDDCWPVTSWSSIDYYGEWKALHYAAKKSFDKYLISVNDTGQSFSVYVVSDDTMPRRGNLIIAAIDFQGKVIWKDSLEINIPEDHAAMVYSKGIQEIRNGLAEDHTFLKITLTQKNLTLASAVYYFRKPKDLLLKNPDIRFNITDLGNHHYSIELLANTLAKNVFLQMPQSRIHFTENYFDLLPEETKTVFFDSELPLQKLQRELVIQSLSDSY